MIRGPSISDSLRIIIPPCVILYMLYAEWAFSYLFCYNHVYLGSQDKAAMLSFLVVANVLWFCALISWAFIFIKGPGTLPCKIPPYELSKFIHEGEKFSNVKNPDVSYKKSNPDTSSPISLNHNVIPPPDIFECDYNGLPFWCSECSTLKLLRCRHSSVKDRCIPMFDHFCTFVGSTIGKNNFDFFLYFLFSMQLLMCFTCISVIVYSGVWGHLHAAFIVFLITAGFMDILVGNLAFNTIGDIYLGEITIERLQRTRTKKMIAKNQSNKNDPADLGKFVNVQHPTNRNLRVLVKLLPSDKPYNNGFKKNLRLWYTDFEKLGNAEQISKFQYSMFSEKFKRSILERINSGKYVIFGSQTKLQSVSV